MSEEKIVFMIDQLIKKEKQELISEFVNDLKSIYGVKYPAMIDSLVKKWEEKLQ